MSRVALPARVAAVALLLAAGVTWVALNREVTLNVDGERRSLHTHARTVGALLDDLGHELHRRDRVRPALDEPVPDGGEITVARARRMALTLDGRTRYVWVNSHTVTGVLRELKMADAPVKLSADRDDRVPLRGARLRVDTRKEITLVRDMKERKLTTYASTVDDLLVEHEIALDSDDRTQPEQTSPLRDGLTVTVQRITTKDAVETSTVPAPEQVKQDSSLMKDQKKVTSEGKDGKVEQKIRYVYADGAQIERQVVSVKTVVEPQPRVVVEGSKDYPPDDTGKNWAALAQCESGGNPRAVSANGTYHGLYQFSVSTWQRTGGIGLPSEATPREQTYRAILLYKRAGAGQWPECGSRL